MAHIGLYRGSIGIMEKKMEVIIYGIILCRVYRDPLKVEALGGF